MTFSSAPDGSAKVASGSFSVAVIFEITCNRCDALPGQVRDPIQIQEMIDQHRAQSCSS